MNQHYTSKFIAATLLLLIGITGKAQHIEYLNANNVSAGIAIGGNLFSRIDTGNFGTSNFSLFEAPKGSGIKPIFTSALWIGGIDVNSNALHMAAQRYKGHGMDFYDGPIVSDYTFGYDQYFSRVFKITRAQVEAHRALTFPATNQQVNSALLLWPAERNFYVSQTHGVSVADNLAPYVDVDGDNRYDATKGDYPDFCGEEAIFFVYNDARAQHFETGGNRLSIEVHGLAEVFIDNTPGIAYEKRVLNNTVFVHYEIVKKAFGGPFRDLHVGVFEDGDLGCFSNDYIGCDTVRNLMYAYNGTSPDFVCGGVNGLAPLDAAQGVLMLNRKLNAFGTFDNSVGLATSDPETAQQYYNYMTGKWADGTPFTYSGNGHTTSATTVTHLFPGDINDSTQWSEVHPQHVEENPSGDRRMYGSTGPMTLAFGERRELDIAFILSYDSTSNRTQIVDTLKRDADIVQSFYDSNIVACRAAQQPVGINEADKLAEISLFPNPASSIINIRSEKPINSLSLMDVQGKVILANTVGSNNATLDVSKLDKGVYLLQLHVGNTTATRKVVVE